MDEKWAVNFLKFFRLSITNLRIYPLNNTSVINAINTVESSLQEYFQTKDDLTLVLLSGEVNIAGIENLPLDGKLITKELAKNFDRCNLSSLTIKKGFTREQLIFVLQNLSRYFKGDWQKEAEQQGYKDLGFNQVRYVAISEQETVVNKISALVSEKGSDVFGVVSLLKEAYDFIDTVPSNERPNLITHLAIELSKQDASVLREIFERELPAKIEQSGLKEKLLASLTKEKISDIYQQIIKWYSDIKSSGMSDFEAVEHLEKLKKFLAIILKSRSASEVPFALYEELFKLGLIDSIPETVQKETIPRTLTEQLEIVLNISDEEVVSSLWAEKIPEIFDKLIDAQLRDKLIKLLLKILGNHKSDDYNIRTKASEILTDVIKIIKARGYENILSVAEHIFLAWFENENMRSVYESLSEILFDRIVNRLLNSEFDPARKIFELFKLLASELNSDEEKKKFVANFLNKKTSLLIPILLNDVKSADEIKKKNSFEFLSKLGEEALDPLVKIIKEVEDIRLRMLAAGILKNLGPIALERVRQELNLGLTKEEIKRFLEVLKFIGNGQFGEETKDLLRYPDAEVKIEILRYLVAIDFPEVDKLLLEFLTDPALSKTIIRILPQRRTQESISSLIHLMATTKDWELKEEIAIAMGEIGDKRFEKPLLDLLRSRRGLFRPMSGAQEKARLRAAYVLRKFKGNKEILKALRKASKDKSQAIAITSAESLRILESQNV